MRRKYCSAFIFVICLAAVATESRVSYSGDRELKIGDVIAEYNKSIGKPEVLKGIKSRRISGTALVEFIQGGTGKMAGQSLVGSQGNQTAIIMKFGGTDYPGEHFAFDGKEVTVAYMSPGQRSPLADFIYRYHGLMKEGLLGGEWSLNWPLLHADKNKSRFNLKGKKEIDGTEMYEIEYRFSDKKMNDVKVKLYLDCNTFRHVRTEYSVRIRGEMGLQAEAVVGDTSSDGSVISGALRPGSIHDAIPDSVYVLVEKFGDFKEEGDLMVPHQYIVEYSVEGQGSTFLANWTILAEQWADTR